MSSPSNQAISGGHVDTGELRDLLASDARKAVIEHLLDAGEATVEELTAVACQASVATTPTDHDRVRTAVALHVDHLPVLEEHGLVYIDNDIVELPFLPSGVTSDMRAVLENDADN